MVWSSESIDKLWDFNDPAASEERFREAIEQGAGEEAVTQLARSLGLQRRFDEARATLESIPIPTASDHLKARWNLEMGRVLNSSGRKGESVAYFERALHYADAAGSEFYSVDAAHMLGIVAEGDESLRWNMAAIERAGSSADSRARDWRASLLNNTGWSLHGLGRFSEALELFVQAKEARIKQGRSDLALIAEWCIARCLRSLGRLDDALSRQKALLTEREDDGYVHEEIGECLLALGRGGEAAPYFRSACDLLGKDEWLQAEEPERLERLKTLGGGG